MQNRNLPRNLYSRAVNGTTYYTYRHPVTKVRHGFGTNREQAIDAAIQLNQAVATGASLAARVMGQDKTIAEYVKTMTTDTLPGKRIKGQPMSANTLREYTRILGLFAERFGHIAVADLDQQQLAAYLNERPSAEAFNKHRGVLVTLYKHAISDGYASENTPERIIKRDTEAKRRQRLDLDGYKAIYAKARPPIQSAMEIALNFLHRRADIQSFRFDDLKEGYFYRVIEKTKRHGEVSYLKIPATLPAIFSMRGSATLQEVVNSCRSDLVCPYLIHERPRRYKKSTEKAHHFQLSKKQISDGFAQARDASGYYDHLPPAERPTLHEIISLGEYLMQQDGRSLKFIQQLRGHSKESTTLEYLKGHDKWTTVRL